jgi:small subunit ribosomal protein S2
MADAKDSAKEVAPTKTAIPEIKELLKAGVQFGHETKRWNPKMAKYIFGAKNNIHIIDITKTETQLAKAVAELEKLAAKGEIIFVGTKRQASDLIKKYAIESNSYFMANRWVGGFFTNFRQVNRSLRTLRELETQFETGVEGRTKYEISRMKQEWQKLNRMYEGVKTLDKPPVAVIVVDPRYEKGVVMESRHAKVPVFALADSNCDPDEVDYLIPGNDDAIGSIEIVLSTLAKAIRSGNGGKGVKHELKDYNKAEVKIIRKAESEIAEPVIESIITVESEPTPEAAAKPVAEEKPKKARAKKASGDGLEGGILGRSRAK